MKWWQWILIVIGGLAVLFGVPYLLNAAILSEQRFDVVGDGTHWLSFWGSYLSAIASLAMIGVTLFVLNKQLCQNHEENEANRTANKEENEANRQLQLKIFKYQQGRDRLHTLNKLHTQYIEFNPNIFSIRLPFYLADVAEAAEMCERIYSLTNHFSVSLCAEGVPQSFYNKVAASCKDTTELASAIHTISIHFKKGKANREQFIAFMQKDVECEKCKKYFAEIDIQDDLKNLIVKAVQCMIEDNKSMNVEILTAFDEYINLEKKRVDNILTDTDNGTK